MEDQNGGMGEFVYFGISKELKKTIDPSVHTSETIELKINIDPVPLSKSGSKQFVPILCKVHFKPDIYEVFTVAIFSGQAKPKCPEIFLEQFVEEINELHKDGIMISKTKFKVQLKCAICDTPARAFLKKTVGHGGIYACERCTVEGERINNRTVYPSVDADRRSNFSFRHKLQPEHHHSGNSPLLNIRPMLNIISFFVLDFMHLVCIGIVKKLLEYWTSGNLNFRLSRKYRIELSRRMNCLKAQIPCEFQRKPRSTNFVAKWKATEFRFFILYCGPIVLKELLRKELYNHFMLLFASCRILCSDALCLRYTSHAKTYLRSFFIAMKDYYGRESQILNAHHLIHLPDDVKFMQCSLSHFTAFPFENYLGKMKRFIRTANRPLAQICRRLHELNCLKKAKPCLPPFTEVIRSKKNEVKKIVYKNFTITGTSPDNMLILNDNTIIQINQLHDNLMIEGNIWEKKKPIFTYPTNSKKFNMWQLENYVSSVGFACSIHDVKCKLVKLSLSLKENGSEKVYVIPLAH